MQSINELNLSPDVVFTAMPDGTGVLLNMKTKFYYTLNETGVALWRALENSDCSPSQAALHLTKAFDVEIQDAERDVALLVQQLVDESLLQS